MALEDSSFPRRLKLSTQKPSQNSHGTLPASNKVFESQGNTIPDNIEDVRQSDDVYNDTNEEEPTTQTRSIRL